MRARVGHVLEAPGSFPVFGNTSDVRCALAFMHPRQRLGVKAFLIVEHDEPPMRPGIDELECTLAVT